MRNSHSHAHFRYARFRHGLTALLLILGIALPAGLAAQEDNLERLRGTAAILSDSLLSLYGAHDTICAFVVNHDGAWMMDQAIVSAAELRKMFSRRCDGITGGNLVVAITEMGVEYREVDDQDQLERDVSMSITATLPGMERSVRAYTLHRLDTVNADRTSLLEASGYPFTKGIGPARNGGGFWKKIVEPAVVIAASAVIVILLFTVRSQ